MTTTTPAPPTNPFTIGETDCTFRPLTVGDRVEFERWARAALLDLIAGVERLDAKALTDAAVAAVGLGWGSPAMIDLASSLDGIARLVWLSTRHSHRLTPDEVRQRLTEDQLHQAVRLLVETASTPALPASRVRATDPT